MNLVESLQGQFSTELCKKLGGLVGANESDMRKLIDAGLPCILASLALIASKPSGAQTIAKALDRLGPNAFGSTEKILESGAMNSGGSLLNNILGNNLVDQITTTVSTYTRVNPSTVRIGLGYFMPLILGTVGAETADAAAQPCNATSIANLFRTHRRSIISAIPDELPLPALPNFQSFIKKASHGDQGLPVEPTNILGPSLVSLAVLIAFAVAGIFVFDRNRKSEKQPTQGMSPTTRSRPQLVVGASGSFLGAIDQTDEVAKNEGPPKAITSIKSRVKISMDSLATVLESINDTSLSDVNSETFAEAITNLDSLAESTKSMPSEGRSVVASLAKSYSKQLNPLIENALQMPELSDSIRKSLLQVRDKLQAMAG
jgi:hypothetical protein